MRRRMPTRMPPPAVAVRGLWAQATEEERRRAFEAGTGILGWWLGVTPKGEVLERLQVKPLRLWQMSQMALSGMLAGLLKQPKKREKVPPGTPAAESREGLKKKIQRLERDLRSARELVGLLRTLPAWRKDGPKTDTPRDPGAGRRAAPKRRQQRGAKGLRRGARREPAHAVELGAPGAGKAGAKRTAGGPGEGGDG